MNKHIRHILAAGALLLLSGCMNDTAFHASHSLPGSEWDMRDTLIYSIDTLRLKHPLHLTAEIRATKQYPYSFLGIIVEQKWNTGSSLRDTLQIDMDKKTDTQHMSIYLKSFDSPAVTLSSKANKGQIRVYHFMKREILPGITDVGIRISR